MIALVIAFCCGVGATVLWRWLFVQRTAPPSEPPTLPRADAWGREYDVPTYLRQRNTRT